MSFDSLEACIKHLAVHEAEKWDWSKEERIAWWKNYLSECSSSPPGYPPHWRAFPYYDLDTFMELVERLSVGKEQIAGLESSEMKMFEKVANYLQREKVLEEMQPSKHFDFEIFRKTINRLIGSEGMVVEDVTAERRVLTKLEITLWATLRYLINVERIYEDI